MDDEQKRELVERLVAGATIGNLVIDNHGTMTLNYHAKGEAEQTAVEATSKEVAAAVRGCSELWYGASAMTVVYAVCRDVCHWTVGQSDFERMMTLEGLECKSGTLANALRNNPYMRDHISKWASLGARSEVLKLRDALCESLRAGAAT